MKKRILKIITVILTSFSIMITSIPVYADESGGGGIGRDENGNITEHTSKDSWSAEQKEHFFDANFNTYIGTIVGIVCNPIQWGTVALRNAYQDYLIEHGRILDANGYQDYIDNHMEFDSEGNCHIDDIFADDFYDAISQYVDANSGWYNITIPSYKDISPNYFDTKSHYEQFCGTFVTAKDSEILINSFNCNSVVNGSSKIASMEFGVLDDEEMVFIYGGEDNSWYDHKTYGIYIVPYDKDWNRIHTVKAYTYDIKTPNENITIDYAEISFNGMEKICKKEVGSNEHHVMSMLAKTRKTIRVYKSLDDYKATSVGQQPYYAGSTYYNYDSSQDNSCTLTNSQLQNSSVYGDVQNIVNNIENGDSLTEDELRDILDDYFNRLYNINPPSGGGGNGNGNDSSSGGGLGGLLSGIGALLETLANFVGRLIEMIAEVFNKLLDRFVDVEEWCTGFSELVGSFFPYVPEEIIDIVCLGLTVSIIIAIIKAFKG